MLQNVRILSATVCRRRSLSLCLLLFFSTAIACAHGDRISGERAAYTAAQRKLHDAAKKVRKDLNNGEKVASRVLTRFKSVMIPNGVSSNGPDFADFRTALRYTIFELSNPTIWNDTPELQKRKNTIDSLIRRAGSNIAQKRAKEKFRKLFCTEVHTALLELLDNNFIPRSVAVQLMSSLFITDRNAPQNVRVLLRDGGETLVSVLEDENQPDSLKVGAVQSIMQFMERTDAGAQMEFDFVRAIAKELESPLTNTGYQVWLANALSMVKSAREPAGRQQSAAIGAAAFVLQDKRRDPLVRCAASNVIGRAGFDGNVNFDPLAWKIAQVAIDTGHAYNDREDGQEEMFANAGLWLFGAFHHFEEEDAGRKTPHGMLNRAARSETVNGAYQAILPIVKAICVDQVDVPAEALNAAQEWVTQNKPDNLTFDQASPPLTE